METTLARAMDGRLKIVRINGGRNLVRKLYSMGIYEGVVIEKILSYSKGPVIVKVHNSQVAIGRGMAEKLSVEKID